MLLMKYTAPFQQEQAVRSVHVAAQACEHPVFLHLVPGVVGHLGQARDRGYAQGQQPYVTFVDDDDWVEPQAFQRVIETLLKFPDTPGITTGEYTFFDNGAKVAKPKARHHLAVYKRDCLVSLADKKFYPDQWQLQQQPLIHLEECLYNHRISMGSGSRKQRRANVEAAAAEAQALEASTITAEAMSAADIEEAINRELRKD